MTPEIRTLGVIPKGGRTGRDLRYAKYPEASNGVDAAVPAELQIGEEEFAHYAAGLNSGLRALILPVTANGSSFRPQDITMTLQAAAHTGFPGRRMGDSVEDSLKSMEGFNLITPDPTEGAADESYVISKFGSTRGLAYIGGPFLTAHRLGVRADRLWGNNHPRPRKEPRLLRTEEGIFLYKPRTAHIRYRVLQELLLEAKRVRFPERVVLRQKDVAVRMQEDAETVGFSLEGMAQAGVLTYEREPNKARVRLTKAQHEILLELNAAFLKFRLGDASIMQRYRENALAMVKNPSLVAQLIDQSLPMHAVQTPVSA